MKITPVLAAALLLGIIYGVFAFKISVNTDGSANWSGILLSIGILLVAVISLIARRLGAGARFFLQGLVLAAIAALIGWELSGSGYLAGLFGIGGFAANAGIAKIDFDK